MAFSIRLRNVEEVLFGGDVARIASRIAKKDWYWLAVALVEPQARNDSPRQHHQR